MRRVVALALASIVAVAGSVGVAGCTSSGTAPSAPGTAPSAPGTQLSGTRSAAASGQPSPSTPRPDASTPGSTTTPGRADSGRLTVRTIGHLPVPLSRMAVAASNGQLVVAGGLLNGGSSDSVVRVTPAGVAAAGDRLEHLVHDTAAALVGGTVLVFGGGAASEVRDVQAVVANGRATTRGQLPAGRSDLNAITVGASTYVIGGYDGSRELASVLATTDGVHFRVVGQLPVTVRYAAVVAVGTTIWVIGGDHHFAPTDAVQRIDTTSGRITLAGHLAHPLGHASAWLARSGAVYVAGGTLTNTTRTATIARFDPKTLRLTPVGSLPRPTSDMGVAVLGGVAFLIGGESTSPHRLDTIVTVTGG